MSAQKIGGLETKPGRLSSKSKPDGIGQDKPPEIIIEWGTNETSKKK